MLVHDMEETWQCQFLSWSQQCFDIMTKMNDNVTVRDVGTLLNQYWWKRLHKKGAWDFDDDGYWLRLIHDGSTEKRLDYCQDKDGKLSYFRAIQGYSDGIPLSPEVPLSQKESMDFSDSPGEWNNSRRKRGRLSSPSNLSDTIQSFGKGSRRGDASFRLHTSSKSFIWN